MKEVLLTTRYTDDIYKLIINACLKDINKKKICIKPETIKFKKKPDFIFLFYCLIILIKGSFFRKDKIALLKFKNVNFGKNLLSITFRSYDTYNSKYKFYYHLFKNIYKISIYYQTAEYYLKNYKFNNVYLDHLEYLNGIFYQIFINKNKCIFTNRYPRNIIKTKNKKISKIFQVKFVKKSFSKLETKKIILKSREVFNSVKDYIPWMYHTKYHNGSLDNLNKYKYIIYAQSFTDSQLEHGYDGFTNTFEWLKYTIEKLNRKNVSFIVKAHPNFYINTKINSLHERSRWDQKIYYDLINKYRLYKNILFINKPVENIHVIKRLNKKCIAITKHGSVQLEMIHNNFKIISSACNLIDPKYKISNTWKNKKEYQNLLNRDWDKLKFFHKNNYLNIIHNLFLDKNSFYGENFYINQLRKQMVKKNYIKKNSSYEDTINKFNKINNKNQIIDQISLAITKI